MSETKAAFAERAIQSLKHIIYRYIEDHGEKIIHKMPQIVSTMNCRVNRSIKKSPGDVKNTGFPSILYNKPLTPFTDEFLKFRHYLLKYLLYTSSKISTKKKLWENFTKKS